MRILVVEDDIDQAKLLRVMFGLNRPDWHVRLATEGFEDLDDLTGWDVVISDLWLVGDRDGFNGCDVLRRAKELDPDTYTILVSAVSDVQKVHPDCADVVLRKPVDHDYLLGLIERAA